MITLLSIWNCCCHSNAASVKGHVAGPWVHHCIKARALMQADWLLSLKCWILAHFMPGSSGMATAALAPVLRYCLLITFKASAQSRQLLFSDKSVQAWTFELVSTKPVLSPSSCCSSDTSVQAWTFELVSTVCLEFESSCLPCL